MSFNFVSHKKITNTCYLLWLTKYQNQTLSNSETHISMHVGAPKYFDSHYDPTT